MFKRFLPLLAALALAGCAGISPQDRELARVHESLAQQSLGAGDPRAALAEIEQSIEKDPENAKARNLYGLLLHIYFGRFDAAIAQYRQAIRLDPGYSEAKVNLGAVYSARDRCDLAVPLLEEARKDLLYREPYLAENNLGWCKYQLGDLDGALLHLQAAVSNNPDFCLGWRNLGEINETTAHYDQALRHYQRYAQRCPTVADADFRLGVLHLKRGDLARAQDAFHTCEEKAAEREPELSDICARQAAMSAEE